MLFGEEHIELIVVLLLEVRAVLRSRQTGVAVGGDDEVRVVICEFHDVLLQSVANS